MVKNVGLTNIDIEPGANAWYVAALVGDCYGTVEKCWVASGSMTVNGGGNIATLVGMVRDGGSVTNFYSCASLTVTNGPDYMAGGVKGDSGMTNCYFAGSITGSVSGGFNALGTPTSCYYDMTISYDDDSGLERTTAQMKQEDTFVNWDFDDVWTIVEDVSYPTLISGPDTSPPTPNPATFSSAPAADSSSAISMTATTGSDDTGPVEYYFNETSENSGGTDSGWQTSPSYTDTGLSASTQYTYTVQMRDSASPTPNVGT